MSALRHQIRRGAYADSIVLMQLQAALAREPGVEDAGVAMATAANLALLAESSLVPEPLPELAADDLLIVVRAVDDDAAAAALARLDELLAARRGAAPAAGGLPEIGDFRPRSLRTALVRDADAGWVAISVPGRWAAGVAREALAAGRHVFLYSDNVSLADEIELKRLAAARGLLLMGPDCGTALVGGAGLGFANRVESGPVGLVAASGTGLQAVTTGLDALGVGISHALGCGGRDLTAEVGGSTALRALELLARDVETRVIVLVSKPPAGAVAARVVIAARAVPKPVVISFTGVCPPLPRLGNLLFAPGLELAVQGAATLAREGGFEVAAPEGRESGFLRGLFAGGTLALEVLEALRLFLAPLHSNLPRPGVEPLPDVAASVGHTVLDLGADEFTVGRPHPMIDPDLRLRRLAREAADPTAGRILLDVVLGDGAEADPAAALAPAIAAALARRSDLAIAVLVVGAGADPQGLEEQVERLAAAGALVFRRTSEAIAWAAGDAAAPVDVPGAPVALAALAPPRVVNVGLELFAAALAAQGTPVVHVEWRPPAGGDDELAGLLERLRAPLLDC